MAQALEIEPIVVALYDRLREFLPGITAWGREDVAPGDVRVWPSANLVQLRETPDDGEGMTPTVWDLDLELIVHVMRERAEVSPDTALNAMARDVEAALLMQTGEAQRFEGEDETHTTLGGLAVWCRAGARSRGRGPVSGHAFIVVPITVRAFAQSP